SIDDFQSDEWNTAAVGPTKRDRADVLIRRLRERFAPGGFLHYGQGKWYPGESLPRWTFSLYWRKDGLPIWSDPSLIAVEGRRYEVTEDDAGRLLTAIAGELDITPDMVVPAFEDPGEWILREANLPDNVDPANSKLKDPEERNRLARVFERGLTRPSGYVMPVQAWNSRASGRRWISEKWRTRRGRIFLVPGDSPVGYRLPLNALPYIPPSQYPYINPMDPSIPRAPLPNFQEDAGRPLQAAHFEPFAPDHTPQPRSAEEIGGYVRTAMSVEPRDGRLCVFMPPTVSIEDYLDLVASAERAAAQLGLPVHIEGYAPPHDERINVIRVAPDPGVIEVNI
ncbi:transglutaminase family protein, partial [Rhizobium straminoryzae]